MSTREIQGHLEEVKSWQNRPLDAVYPIVYLDALVVKIREAGHVRNKGVWAGQAEGAKFWLQVITELKNRGMADIFIVCVAGLKGFPEAIETVFPQAQVQSVSGASSTSLAELPELSR